MKTFKEIIENCKDPELEEFAKNLTFAEFHKSCPRGGWMLTVFSNSNPDSLRELTLAKGHCANTVRHLMRDERSLKAVNVATGFGEGRVNKNELDDAADEAFAAASAAYFDATSDDTAASAAYTAASAGDTASSAASAASAAHAKEKNQLQTADICRKYLPLEIWNIADNKEIVSQKTVEDPEVEITQIRYKGELFTKMETKNG